MQTSLERIATKAQKNQKHRFQNLKELRKALQDDGYSYVVEAEIKGYFDNIDHDWLIKMLEQIVDDKAFVGLIRKWLKAGVLNEDGKVIHPLTGTPQFPCFINGRLL